MEIYFPVSVLLILKTIVCIFAIFSHHTFALLSIFPGWTISPPPSNTSFLPIDSNKPLIISSNIVFGFYRQPASQTNTASSLFLLSICVKSEANYSTSYLPIWSLHPDRPLDENAILTLGIDSTLMLIDRRHDNVLWEVPNVSVFDLQDSGNLVLYNQHRQVVWQSFDDYYHPTDILLPGQKMLPGMKLVSQSSKFSAIMEPDGLVFYSALIPYPYPYWKLTLNGSRSSSTNPNSCAFPPPASASLRNNLFEIQRQPCGVLQISWPFHTLFAFVRLDNDGYLRSYGCCPSDALSKFSPLSTLPISFDNGFNIQTRNNVRFCLSPSVCGPFGICNPTDGSCSCFTSSPHIFEPIDALRPALGCALVDPLDQCNATTERNDFLELKNTTFLSMTLYISASSNNTRSLEECQRACMSDCSCVAVFYQHNISVCVPITSAISLVDVNDANFSAYIKIKTSDITLSSPHSSFLRHTSSVAVPSITSACAVCCLIFAILVFVYKRQRVSKIHLQSQADEAVFIHLTSLPRRYSLSELRLATENFSKKLGSGGFGPVYEGVLVNGMKVAVKKLEGTPQGQKHFYAEVATLSGITHLNVVRLLGFCSEGSHRLLIYEHMENGALAQWLFTKGSGQSLDWHKRFPVVLGIAQGLAYLHEECPEPVLHLDIKPDNILLDAHFVPKLSDFGFARIMDKRLSGTTTAAIGGTPGYMAPECLVGTDMSQKCDIYSFGVVLLEIVCGKRITEMFSSEDTLMKVQGTEADLIGILDDSWYKTFGEEEKAQLKRVIRAAIWCTQADPDLRPSIREVVRMLESLKMDCAEPISTTESLFLRDLPGSGGAVSHELPIATISPR